MFQKIIVAVARPGGERDALALAHRLAGPVAELVNGHVAEDGAVAENLFRLATGHAADLLVIGAHHHDHIWSHDHARETLRDAPCAVAVVPEGYADAAGDLRVIGVGYREQDPQSDAALAAAQQLAATAGAEVRIANVVPETNWASADSGAGGAALAARERLAGLDGVVTVLEGNVRSALAEFVVGVDLLVVGSHHHGELRRLVAGDTVSALADDPTCPLLVMPHAPAGN